MYHTHEYIYPIQTVKTKGPSDLKPWPACGQADHIFILFNDLKNWTHAHTDVLYQLRYNTRKQCIMPTDPSVFV